MLFQFFPRVRRDLLVANHHSEAANRRCDQRRSLQLSCAAMLLVSILTFGGRSLMGQEGPPPSDSGTLAPNSRQQHASAGESAERTRTFLGLGPAPDRQAAARGNKLFGPACGFCHGTNARGASGPNLVRSALVLRDEKGELLAPVIHNGRPDKGMPAFAFFSNAQLHDLAEFLHLQVELVANRGTYKVQNAIRGDAKAGEAYFNGPGRCNTCHSATGDLAHVGSKFEAPDLQQVFLYPASRRFGFGASSVAGSEKATVTLASGESVSGTLSYLDDFNVTLFDAAGKAHSFTLGNGLRVQVEDRLRAHRQLLDQYTDDDMHNLTAYLGSLK
jgi:cytochrome c oxidase cbb3-type subunit III